MKYFAPIVLVALLSGCASFDPISTKVEMEEPIALTYTSEKDIVFKRERFDPETGARIEYMELQATASAPSMAQAEREKIQAEINKASMDLATKALERIPGN